MKRTLTFLALVSVLVGCNSNAGWTPSPDEPRAFVSTLGTDTVAVEVYTRTADSIEGILVDRLPITQIVEYVATLNGDGDIVSLRFTTRTPSTNPNGPAESSASVVIADGQATIIRIGGENPDTVLVDVAPGTLPTIGRADLAMFEFEQVANKLQAGRTQTMLLSGYSSAPMLNDARVESPDSVSIDYYGFRRIGWTGAEDQLIGVSGAATPNGTENRRVEPFLVGPYAERWAAMDAAGTGIGVPSPGAVVAITLDKANLEIAYSQPAKRGREVWGQLVPEGEVWRTGANAATQFTTSKDLTFEGQVLPAGVYTVWSVYANGGLSLMFNSQTGQWGTIHDPALDLFSTPTTASDLTTLSERFVISFEDTEAGGSIILDWDMKRFTLAFTVN